MDVPSILPTTPDRDPRPARREGAVLWALGAAILAMLALALLAVGLLVMHGLAYGASAVLSAPGSGIAGPSVDAHVQAFLVAAMVAMGGAVALATLAHRTPARSWPPSLQGFAAAGVAGAAGLCVELLALGIDPVDFLTTL